MSDTNPQLRGGTQRYRHYKGGIYRLICEATVEPTGEAVVVYQSEQDARIWVRSKANFEAIVHGRSIEGTPMHVARFQRITNA